MKIPNQLSYLGSIKPTYGVFYYLDSDKKYSLPLKRGSLRGLKSSYKEGYAKDKKKTNPHALAQSNIIYSDYCIPPVSVEEVFCDFTLRISANTLKPETCHCQKTEQSLINFVEDYAKIGGFSVLARRLSKNLLMGTWLFRNQEKQPSITIKTTLGGSYTVKLSSALEWNEDTWQKADLATLNKLTDEVALALSNNTKFWQAIISAQLPVAPGEELFPSQVMDTKNKDKQLVSINFDGEKSTAAITPQKIGAGLAMIDDWYAENAVKPIRVTEYGGDKTLGISLRHPSKGLDFYTLIKNLEAKQQTLSEAKVSDDITDNIHYVMSVLMKGGLFSKKAEE